MNKFLITISIVLLSLLSGCSKGLFSVHKLDIQQGNALEEEDVQRIQSGMSKDEVQAILGTPVVEPLFQPDRWDYLYYLKEADAKTIQRYVSITFKDDTVVSINKQE